MYVTLKLDEDTQRPLIYTRQFQGCIALLDTGADFPVWTDSEDALQALGGRLIRDNVQFSGFGGVVDAKVYELTVQLGERVYPNMHILFKQDDAIPGHLLLSATMFSGMRYTIDNKDYTMTVDTLSNQEAYNLKIEDRNGGLYVLCSICDSNEQEFQRFTAVKKAPHAPEGVTDTDNLTGVSNLSKLSKL